MLIDLDRKSSRPRKTYPVGSRSRYASICRGQRSMPQAQRSTKPKPVDDGGSLRSLRSEDMDSGTRSDGDFGEFKRRSIRRPSQQSALLEGICSTEDDVWLELPPTPDQSRPQPVRQGSQRSGVWGWNAIVPTDACSGSPAADSVASIDVW